MKGSHSAPFFMRGCQRGCYTQYYNFKGEGHDSDSGANSGGVLMGHGGL